MAAAATAAKAKSPDQFEDEDDVQEAEQLKTESKDEIAKDMNEIMAHLSKAKFEQLNNQEGEKKIASLLKYGEYAFEYEDDVAHLILKRFKYGGFVTFASTFWDWKDVNKFNLDDKAHFAHAIKGFIIITRLIHLISENGVHVCKILVKDSEKDMRLLQRIKKDLVSDKFKQSIQDSVKTSAYAYLTREYIGILFNLLQFSALEERIVSYLQRDLTSDILGLYLDTKSQSTYLKTSLLMTHHSIESKYARIVYNPNAEHLEYLISSLTTCMEKKLWRYKGMHMWDLLLMAENILQNSTTDRNVMILLGGGLLKVIKLIIKSSTKAVDLGESEQVAPGSKPDTMDLGEYERVRAVSCLQQVAFSHFGCFALLSDPDILEMLRGISTEAVEKPIQPKNVPKEEAAPGDSTDAAAKNKHAWTEEGDHKSEMESESEDKRIMAIQTLTLVNEEVSTISKGLVKQLAHTPATGTSTGPRHVMLSYCWKVRPEWVRALNDKLRAMGVATWIDVERLEYGSELQPSMFDAIERAALVIVNYSEFYMRSPNCNYELNKTHQMKRPIFPVVWKHKAPSKTAGDAPAKGAQPEGDSEEFTMWLSNEVGSGTEGELLYFDGNHQADNPDEVNKLLQSIKEKWEEENKKEAAPAEGMAVWDENQVGAWLQTNAAKELQPLAGKIRGEDLVRLKEQAERGDAHFYDKLSKDHQLSGHQAVRLKSALKKLDTKKIPK